MVASPVQGRDRAVQCGRARGRGGGGTITRSALSTMMSSIVAPSIFSAFVAMGLRLAQGERL